MRFIPFAGLTLSGLICCTSALACDTVLTPDVITISESGSYCLNANRDRPILITASQVELDCKGRTVSRRPDSTSEYIGIRADLGDGVTIRNCRVDGYRSGITMTVERSAQLINNTVLNSTEIAIGVAGSRDPGPPGIRLTGNRVIGYKLGDDAYSVWTPAFDVWDAPGVQLINNVVVGYRGARGVLLKRSPDAQLTGNQFLDFMVEASGVIALDESPRARLVHNTVAMDRVRAREAFYANTADHTCVENIAINTQGWGSGCAVSRHNIEQPWMGEN
ncbi:right-handed parallel beta-helix repeat-containing protein [Lysobacter sp. CCNWLW3]|uniref:right-handed parallel beta-helix repeat-containing protein n=1 Tax=unclassified Lysobacter TaxID=2635362 RepID=UPI002FD33D35